VNDIYQLLAIVEHQEEEELNEHIVEMKVVE
jgi:hypothetical protein